jgi:hypothetical protein
MASELECVRMVIVGHKIYVFLSYEFDYLQCRGSDKPLARHRIILQSTLIPLPRSHKR